MSRTRSFPAVAWETETLRFRLLRDNDVPELTAMCRDERSQRFVPNLPDDYTEDDAREFLHGSAHNSWYEGRAQWGIADRPTDRLLGTVGVPRVMWDYGSAEIGYMVAPWARGRGVAAQAAAAVADYLFLHRVTRAELHIRVDNIASQRAALRAGFTREATLRRAIRDRNEHGYDKVIYTRLPHDPSGPVARALPDPDREKLWEADFSLRPLCRDDAEALHECLSQPEAWRHAVPPHPPRYEDVRRMCEFGAANEWLADTAARLSIRDAQGRLAGHIALHPGMGAPGEALLSYGLLAEYRGRGLATRAVNLLARWTFAHTGTARIIAGTAVDNEASQAVLRRAGFTAEGVLRGHVPGPENTRVDMINWSLLRDEI